MKDFPIYKSMSELMDVLRQMKAQCNTSKTEFYPVQPVRVGSKIGFVNWETFELECLPLFDDYDRHFRSLLDCICVRKGEDWGVLNSNFAYELPTEYSYPVANQVCNVMNTRYTNSTSIRKYGTFLKFS